MAASAVVRLQVPNVEDPLRYLPKGRISTVRRGSVIYGQEQPVSGLYFLNAGRAAISLECGGSRRLAFDIRAAGQFLGFDPLMFANQCTERAAALDKCTVVFWPYEAVERQIGIHPRLGVALVQAVVRRSLRLAERVVSMATDNATNRLARLLLWMGEDSGRPDCEGWTAVPPVTHAMLADCLGTSRELITTAMNTLRREGYLAYNRQTIRIAEGALRERLAVRRRRHAGGAPRPEFAGFRNIYSA